jgi:hypothetical protein
MGRFRLPYSQATTFGAKSKARRPEGAGTRGKVRNLRRLPNWQKASPTSRFVQALLHRVPAAAQALPSCAPGIGYSLDRSHKMFVFINLHGAQVRNRTVDPAALSLSSPPLLLLDPPVDVLGEDLRGKRAAAEDGFVEAADVEAGAEGGFGVAAEVCDVAGP